MNNRAWTARWGRSCLMALGVASVVTVALTAPASVAAAATRDPVTMAAAGQAGQCANAGSTATISPTTQSAPTGTGGTGSPTGAATGPITSAPKSTSTLAFTGLDTRPFLDAAVILLTTGGLLVFLGRRPRPSSSRTFGGVVLVGLVAGQFGPPVHTAAACTPAAVLPESPLAALLPLGALIVSGLALTVARRRYGPTARDTGGSVTAGASGTTR